MFKRYFFLSFLTLLFTGSPACACSCIPIGLAEAKEQASIVFIGRVKGVKISTVREGQKEARLEVLKTYKGGEEILTESVLVYTPRNESLCGFRFVIGSDYVVFATGTPAYFKTNACMRNKILELAREEVAELEGKPLPPKEEEKKEPEKPKRTPYIWDPKNKDNI